jgi:hypothetical protein
MLFLLFSWFEKKGIYGSTGSTEISLINARIARQGVGVLRRAALSQQ